MPRPHHLDLTEPEVKSMLEFGLPFDTNPRSPIFTQLLNARLSQLQPTTLLAFSHSTLKFLAMWKGLNVPEKFLFVDTPTRHSEFASWLWDSLEQLQASGVSDAPPPRRHSGSVSLTRLKLKTELVQSPTTTRVISSPVSGSSAEPPWRQPIAAILSDSQSMAGPSSVVSRVADNLLQPRPSTLSPRSEALNALPLSPLQQHSPSPSTLHHQQMQQLLHQQHHANHVIHPITFLTAENSLISTPLASNTSSTSQGGVSVELPQETAGPVISDKSAKEIAFLSQELSLMRAQRDIAREECASTTKALVELQQSTKEEVSRLREAAKVGIESAREHSAADLRLVMETRAEESLKANSVLEAQKNSLRAALEQNSALSAELSLTRDMLSNQEAEALRARAERLNLLGEIGRMKEAVAAEADRSGKAELSLRKEFSKKIRALEEAHEKSLLVIEAGIETEKKKLASVQLSMDKQKVEFQNSLASSQSSHLAEIRELKASSSEASRVYEQQLSQALNAPWDEIRRVQESLGDRIREVTKARDEAKTAKEALAQLEGERKALLTKLDAEKQNFNTLRLRAAAVERDLISKSLGNADMLQHSLDAFSLYAPTASDMVGFLMPQKDGKILSWGAVIEGPLSAWRAANPGALFANLEGRRDIVDADLSLLLGIRALNISGCSQVTDSGLSKLSSLWVLDMSGCTQTTITDQAFSSLSGLRELNMSYCTQNSLTDGAFSNLKNLKALDLSFCALDALGDTGLARVGSSLLWLRAEGISLPTFTGQSFNYLPSLRTLSLTLPESSPLAFSDCHFSHLHRAPLTSLTLWNVQSAVGVSDRAFAALGGLKELELSFRPFQGEGPPLRSRFTRFSFVSQKDNLERLALHGDVPESIREAARAANLKICS